MKKLTGKGARFLKPFTSFALPSGSFFKHKWITVKFITVVCLILYGMFFLETRMLLNIDLLELNGASALESEAFQRNHKYIRYGLILEIAVFVFIISVSVFKPWKKSG